MTSSAAAWLGFLASPAAPRTARSPLELDGFLTGVIVSPEPIQPTRWILALWGEDEPNFEDEAQINFVLGAAMTGEHALRSRSQDGAAASEDLPCPVSPYRWQ